MQTLQWDFRLIKHYKSQSSDEKTREDFVFASFEEKKILIGFYFSGTRGRLKEKLRRSTSGEKYFNQSNRLPKRTESKLDLKIAHSLSLQIKCHVFHQNCFMD